VDGLFYKVNQEAYLRIKGPITMARASCAESRAGAAARRATKDRIIQRFVISKPPVENSLE